MGRSEQVGGGIRGSPVYQLAILEAAIAAGDLARAAEAQAELERMGVKVTYTLRRVSDLTSDGGRTRD
jgi:hypothetical protein